MGAYVSKHMNYLYVAFGGQDFPTQDAKQIANNISNLGQLYNREDLSTDVKVTSNNQNIFIVGEFLRRWRTKEHVNQERQLGSSEVANEYTFRLRTISRVTKISFNRIKSEVVEKVTT